MVKINNSWWKPWYCSVKRKDPEPDRVKYFRKPAKPRGNYRPGEWIMISYRSHAEKEKRIKEITENDNN